MLSFPVTFHLSTRLSLFIRRVGVCVCMYICMYMSFEGIWDRRSASEDEEDKRREESSIKKKRKQQLLPVINEKGLKLPRPERTNRHTSAK